MHEMINERFANRPFGWPSMEVVLLLIRLYVAGEIQFLMGGAAIPRDRAYESITTASKWRNITLLQRVTANPEDVRSARELGRELFSEMGPDSEDGLYAFLRSKLEAQQSALTGYKALADTGSYPGKAEIDAGLEAIKSVLATNESNSFLQRFNAGKSDWEELAENYRDLQNFYGSQKPTWDKLRAAHSRFTLNRMELERDEQAARALQRMHDILVAPAPYGLIREADDLIRRVADVNDALVSQRRESAVSSIQAQTELVQRDLDSADANESLRETCLGPLQRLRIQTATQASLAHLSQAEAEAVNLKDTALAKISEYLRGKAAKTSAVNDKPVIKPTRVIKPASLAQQTYLETADDVHRFIGALKSAMDEAVANDERIEIR
jgi:hypothetical protein